jgi:hypothetical protein
MADGGSARPKFERGRGFRWPEVVVRALGVVGKSVALERGTGEEWVTEEWTAFRARFETAARRLGREGKREGEREVQPRECHAARGSVVGPGPNRRAVPQLCLGRP